MLKRPTSNSAGTHAEASRHRDQPRRFSARGLVSNKLWTGVAICGLAIIGNPVAAKDKAVRPVATSVTLASRANNPVASLNATPADAAGSHHRADFGGTLPSHDARQIADWIIDSADNLGLPFIIVDKVDAKVFVFEAGGRLQGATPALLGQAFGDHSVPGIGDREYADMPPDTRTTPAGRFISAMGINELGEDVLWVDYDAGVSLHRVITGNAKEQRLRRLATATPRNNRISYGCINVPVRFYEKVVRPAFAGVKGVVYVLPETRPAQVVFGSYDVGERWRRQYADRY